MDADDTQELHRDQTQQLPTTVAVRQTRRIAVGILGGIFVGAGIVLIPLPGPGILVIILGLTIFSWEFVWARRLLHRSRQKLKELRNRRRSRA